DPSTLTLLRQGQLVTVVLSSSTGLDGPVGNELLAERVPVLWTPALSQGHGGLLPVQDNEGIVVVAASAEQAVRLAGAISRGKVFLILLN
ncbi:MAG: flagellar biosynthesis protein FlgA, partial [Arthrobacter sp.]|nr:flagellar biosynthesis protein FlgA [Arthrobacter sp.]